MLYRIAIALMLCVCLGCAPASPGYSSGTYKITLIRPSGEVHEVRTTKSDGPWIRIHEGGQSSLRNTDISPRWVAPTGWLFEIERVVPERRI